MTLKMRKIVTIPWLWKLDLLEHNWSTFPFLSSSARYPCLIIGWNVWPSGVAEASSPAGLRAKWQATRRWNVVRKPGEHHERLWKHQQVSSWSLKCDELKNFKRKWPSLIFSTIQMRMVVYLILSYWGRTRINRPPSTTPWRDGWSKRPLRCASGRPDPPEPIAVANRWGCSRSFAKSVYWK